MRLSDEMRDNRECVEIYFTGGDRHVFTGDDALTLKGILWRKECQDKEFRYFPTNVPPHIDPWAEDLVDLAPDVVYVGINMKNVTMIKLNP